MTDEEAKALGKRAVSTGLWVDKDGLWPDGALAGDGRRCVASTWHDGPWHVWWAEGLEGVCEREPPADAWPDFRDDATRGCLLGRVRAVWATKVGPFGLSLIISGGLGAALEIRPDGPRETFCGNTEIEAMVAALEAAPRRGVTK